tara:strand:+ start:1545 stop:1754 length:210 start_codon:yes stop_codon:yes gene_type:complete
MKVKINYSKKNHQVYIQYENDEKVYKYKLGDKNLADQLLKIIAAIKQTDLKFMSNNGSMITETETEELV